MNLKEYGMEEMVLEDGNRASLLYFVEYFPEREEEQKYGIHIKKQIDGENVVQERSGGFSGDEEVAEAILEVMKRNKITPRVLQEVLYDFLMERIGG